MIDLILIGGRIRALRQSRNLTQSEFANILSVSFQAVSNWERGITPPDIENLMRIASYFGVLVDTLLSPAGEDLYIGIDGGGTKTEFAVVTASGCVLKSTVKPGSNPNDAGYAASEEIILGGLRELITEFPAVRGVFGGIAGMSTGTHAQKLESAIKKLYPKIRSRIAGDAINLFAIHDGAEMVVISGTGSVVFVRTGDTYTRLGGWGYLFDRAGSSYDIGRDAVCAALGEEDSRSEPSDLSRRLREKMGVSTVWEHVTALYKGGRSYIAGFASQVFEAYSAGDETAKRIIDSNAKALAELLDMGVKLHGAKPCATASGGIFEHYAHIMIPHIQKYSQVKLMVGTLPPIYGACKTACAESDRPADGEFYENFKRTYEETKK